MGNPLIIGGLRIFNVLDTLTQDRATFSANGKMIDLMSDGTGSPGKYGNVTDLEPYYAEYTVRNALDFLNVYCEANSANVCDAAYRDFNVCFQGNPNNNNNIATLFSPVDASVCISRKNWALSYFTYNVYTCCANNYEVNLDEVCSNVLSHKECGTDFGGALWIRPQMTQVTMHFSTKIPLQTQNLNLCALQKMTFREATRTRQQRH